MNKYVKTYKKLIEYPILTIRKLPLIINENENL